MIIIPSEIRTLMNGDIQILPRTTTLAITNSEGNMLEDEINKKVNKIIPSNPNNIALLDSFGNIADSGKTIDDIGGNSNAISVTLLVSGWTDNSDGRYKQTVSVSGVTTTTKVIVVDCDLSTSDVDAKVEILTAWDGPAANDAVQGDGTLTFYCYDIPAVNIPINIGVM